MGLTKVTRGVIEPFENYDVNNINATGIVTATSFDGIVQSSSLTGALPALDGSALTGVVGAGSGIVVENSGTPVGTAGTVNFDSNLNVSFGAGTATVTVGDTDLSIADKIVHTGDTDTAIRFPAADTFTVETAGEERLRVESGGNVGIGTDDPQQLLHLASTNPRIRIDDTDSGGYYTELRQGGSATYLQLDGNNIGSGNFRITTDGGSEIFRFNDKGNVTIEGSTTSFDANPTRDGLQLYYETDTRLATIASYDGTSGSEISLGVNSGTNDVAEIVRISSTGIDVTGHTETDTLNVSGLSTFQNNIHLLDDDRLQIGGSVGTVDGLEIYHDGSNSYINETGTGGLQVRTSALILRSNVGENMAFAYSNGAVQLYHDNSKKFETTGYGVTVTGIVSATSYYGDGSNLTGISAGAGGTENVSSNTTISGIITASDQFYPPTLTTSERDALTVTQGALIFNTTENKVQMYLGSEWKSLAFELDTYTAVGL